MLGVGLLIMMVALWFMVSVYHYKFNGETLVMMGFFIFVYLFVLFAILDGLRSVHRFRKGYDVDASGEQKKDHDSDTSDHSIQ